MIHEKVYFLAITDRSEQFPVFMNIFEIREVASHAMAHNLSGYNNQLDKTLIVSSCVNFPLVLYYVNVLHVTVVEFMKFNYWV